jgi:HemY protein
MIRVLLFLGFVCLVAFGAVWLADRPGEVAIVWQGYRVETSVMMLAVATLLVAVLSVIGWSILRLAWRLPQFARETRGRRRDRRGRLAITRGLVAIGAGDAAGAARYAREARQIAAHEPLALLLQAQAAQISRDQAGAETAFRLMAERSETRLLGLHGLYIEARRRGDAAAARHFAEEAAQAAPSLPWAGQAVLELRCMEGDWEGALAILDANWEHGLIDKARYHRHGAVLLTARALMLEEPDPGVAKMLAIEATRFAADLVPAAVLAGRLLGEAGESRRAGKILHAAWRKHPHPDVAETYARLRPEDSARDRLNRVRTLVREPEGHPEGLLALARAALDAQEFTLARDTLGPLLAKPTQRVAMLMAELEEVEHGDTGRAREWFARAVRSPRDPAWTADGFVSDRWLPVSPVTGRIDAFEWKVPLEQLGAPAIDDTRVEAAAQTTLPAQPLAAVIDIPQPADAKEGSGKQASVQEDETSTTTAANPEHEVPIVPAGLPEGRAAMPAPAGADAEPAVPLIHVPDDPGPDSGEEREPPAVPRSEGWRFGSLFR